MHIPNKRKRNKNEKEDELRITTQHRSIRRKYSAKRLVA